MLDNVVGMQSFLSSHPSIRVSWAKGKPDKYFFRSSDTQAHVDRNTLQEGRESSSSSTAIEWRLNTTLVDVDVDVGAEVSSSFQHTAGQWSVIKKVTSKRNSFNLPVSSKPPHSSSKKQSEEVRSPSPIELLDEPLKAIKSKRKSIVVGKEKNKKRVSEENPSRSLPLVNIYDIDFNKFQEDDQIQIAGKESDSHSHSHNSSRDGKRLKS